jgi:hypothetical protein
MRRTPVVAIALALGTGLIVALPATAATPSFTGTVGPGFTISLPKKPTKAGKITLVLVDKSGIHDFHLLGPGGKEIKGVDAKTGKAVSKIMTSVGGTGTWKFTLTLAKGKYHYQCDPHKSAMKGDFTVK